MRRLVLVASALLAAAPSLAQDVVVMRRSVSRANVLDFGWKVGDWVTSPACSSAAPATRTVHCARNSDGGVVDEAFCGAQAKPLTADTVEDRRSCTYDWDEPAWGGWSPSACALGATRSRQVSCLRLGDAVPEVMQDASLCEAVRARPATSDTGDVFSGCTYEWQRTGGACDGKSGFRIDTYGCSRTGGSIPAAFVTDAESVALCGEKPAERVADVMCGSGGNLANGDFETCAAAPWSNAGTVHMVNGAGAISGKCSASLTQNYYSNDYMIQQLVTLVPGKKYRLSFRHRADQASSRQSQGIKMTLNSFTSNLTVVDGVPSGKYPNYNTPAVWPEYGWAIMMTGPTVSTASVTFTATAASGLVIIENNGMGMMYVDDISLFPEP